MRALAAVCLFALPALAAGPVVTVYNRDFAVIPETVPLQLKQGGNEVRYSDAAAHIEPESVILRDPSAGAPFQILEQTFLGEPVSYGLLLQRHEGQVLEFESRTMQGEKVIVRGKLIRAGYVPHSGGQRRYGGSCIQTNTGLAYTAQPLVEVDGKLLFELPGRALLPPPDDDSILKPTLVWRLNAPAAVRLDAELSYLTGGFSWEADYNLVLAEDSDVLAMTGWVTVDNQSGKSLRQAMLKLVAGDVQRVARQSDGVQASYVQVAPPSVSSPQIVTREFDEYHMLTVERPVDLGDRETKQIEFLNATGVKTRRLYVYDGRTVEQGNDYANSDGVIDTPAFGVKSHSKVWVMREFENNRANNLGVALPKGRARFYRRDHDGRMEFIGEGLLDHTPRNERVTVYTGNAFDVTGARRRTSFLRRGDDENRRPFLQETFEITLRNHRSTPARVQVVEHLKRSANWTVQSIASYRKLDSHMIRFEVDVKPEDRATVTYTVRYQW